MRVKHDDVATGLLCVQERVRLHHGRLQQVRAGHDKRLRVHPVARFARAAAEHIAADGRRRAVARATVDAGLHAGGAAQKRRQKAETRFVRRRHVHGLLAVFAPRLAQLVAYRLDGFIPADGLEFVVAALSHAAHGRLQALVAVNMLNLGDALHAHVTIVRVNRVVGLDHGQAAVAHRALQRAAARAHELMQRVDGFLFGGLLRRGAKPRITAGHRAGSGKSRRPGRADFEKVPTGKASACVLHSRHLSSSVFVRKPHHSCTVCAVCNRRPCGSRQAPPLHTTVGQPFEPYITLILN